MKNKIRFSLPFMPSIIPVLALSVLTLTATAAEVTDVEERTLAAESATSLKAALIDADVTVRSHEADSVRLVIHRRVYDHSDAEAAKILEAIQESVVQTAMLFAIAISGKLFVVFIALSDIPSDVLALITQGEPSVFLVMGLIVALYLFLGMVLDPLGIILLTLPLTVPIVEAYDLSLIWFGVIVVKLLEVGLVTPPIGLNVFIIKAVVGDRIPLETIFRGIAWFLLADAVVVALLLAFPQLSLFLPSLM